MSLSGIQISIGQDRTYQVGIPVGVGREDNILIRYSRSDTNADPEKTLELRRQQCIRDTVQFERSLSDIGKPFTVMHEIRPDELLRSLYDVTRAQDRTFCRIHRRNYVALTTRTY